MILHACSKLIHLIAHRFPDGLANISVIWVLQSHRVTGMRWSDLGYFGPGSQNDCSVGHCGYSIQ